jgi:acyl-CoA hydrolase
MTVADKQDWDQYPESEVTVSEVVFPSQVNQFGNLFGGVALGWMDRTAWICSTRFARATMVTIASDRVEFRKPIPQGDLVQLRARVVRVGQTSVTVEVRLHSEDPLSGERHLATQGKFVMVAIDESGEPTPVQPKSQLDTDT